MSEEFVQAAVMVDEKLFDEILLLLDEHFIDREPEQLLATLTAIVLSMADALDIEINFAATKALGEKERDNGDSSH